MMENSSNTINNSNNNLTRKCDIRDVMSSSRAEPPTRVQRLETIYICIASILVRDETLARAKLVKLGPCRRQESSDIQNNEI